MNYGFSFVRHVILLLMENSPCYEYFIFVVVEEQKEEEEWFAI